MDELAQRLEIARAQSKRVQREARFLTQMLAGILDLQAPGHKENQDGNAHSNKDEDSE
jgi:hypothetical protein